MDIRHHELMARAGRALTSRSIGEVLTRVRAIVGVPQIPDSERAAQLALDKLHNGEVPIPQELAALELVIRMLRPAPLSRNGKLDPLPSGPGTNLYNPQTVGQWESFRSAVQHDQLYSIGRIDRVNQGPVGTGFVVASDLLATNRHVLGALTYGAESLQKGQAIVHFKMEKGSVESPGFDSPITEVVAIHPSLDMVLLRIERAARRQPLEIDTTQVTKGHPIATIGYPSDDKFRSPIFADSIFQQTYDVKRAALGEVLDWDHPVIFHDCSTMGGNSGSPIFSLVSHHVVGIHRSGFFMYRNEGVDAQALAGFVNEQVK